MSQALAPVAGKRDTHVAVSETHRRQTVTQGYRVYHLLREQRRFVTTVVILGTMFFLLVAVVVPNSYEATTQLMPPDFSLPTALRPGTDLGASDLSELKSSGALLINILDSDTVRNRLIDRFDLRKVYSVDTYRGARHRLDQHTAIQENTRSGIMTITTTDCDADRSAALARAYVEELNRVIVDLSTSTAHRERIFLEGRIKATSQDLDRAAKALSEFSSKSMAIDLEEQGRATLNVRDVLRARLIAAESELSGLRQIYTPSNVRVETLQAERAELRRQLMKMDRGVLNSASDDTEQFYPTIRQIPVLSVTFDDLFQRVGINEGILEALVNEYQLATIEGAKQVSNLKVLDEAKSSERRFGPPRLLIILSGTLLSFCVSVLWLLGTKTWMNMDSKDSRKMLPVEIATVAAYKIQAMRSYALALRAAVIDFWYSINRSRQHSEETRPKPS
jgi:capsule polysaccharide export protein KpsE/RkpR